MLPGSVEPRAMMKLTAAQFPSAISFEVLVCLASRTVGAALESAERSRVARRLDFILTAIFDYGATSTTAEKKINEKEKRE